MKSLEIIGYAWPAEFLMILVYGLVAIAFMPADRVELFFRFLPIVGMLVAAQGGLVYIGKKQP